MKRYITRKHVIIEILAYAVMVISIILLTVYVMRHGGEKVPTHYNWKGEVDGWGSAASALIAPAVMLFVNIMISLISYFCPPESFNLPVRQLNPVNAAAVYGDGLTLLFLLELELSAFCFYEAITYLLEIAENSGWFILIFVLAVFLTIIIETVRMIRHNNA